jgi:hypothetical protein
MSVRYATVHSAPVTSRPGCERRGGVLRLLDSFLLAQDLPGLSASEPTINRLAETVAQTRHTGRHDGVEIRTEWSAHAVHAGRLRNPVRKGTAQRPDHSDLSDGVPDLGS